MKKLLLLPVLLFSFVSCAQAPTSFTDEALKEPMKTIDGKEMAFKDILAQYEGKTIVIDVWASWCPDCIKGMPKVHALQHQYKDNDDIVFLFLSYDKTEDAWKNGREKYHVVGEHYLITSKWKGGAFSDAIRLDWIPRYMIVDPNGNIALFKAIEADDQKLTSTLQRLVKKK